MKVVTVLSDSEDDAAGAAASRGAKRARTELLAELKVRENTAQAGARVFQIVLPMPAGAADAAVVADAARLAGVALGWAEPAGGKGTPRVHLPHPLRICHCGTN